MLVEATLAYLDAASTVRRHDSSPNHLVTAIHVWLDYLGNFLDRVDEDVGKDAAVHVGSSLHYVSLTSRMYRSEARSRKLVCDMVVRERRA